MGFEIIQKKSRKKAPLQLAGVFVVTSIYKTVAMLKKLFSLLPNITKFPNNFFKSRFYI